VGIHLPVDRRLHVGIHLPVDHVGIHLPVDQVGIHLPVDLDQKGKRIQEMVTGKGKGNLRKVT